MIISGHQKQRDLLSIMVASGDIPHAMIFEGPSKIGKKRVALNFIQGLFCENGSACGLCRPCSDLVDNTHPDLIIITPQEREIQISQIRGLSQKFSLKPYLSRIKAAIIDDAHLMNRDSQNSILKLLEEPAGDSVIILVTDHPELLLPTVRSRSRRIVFFPIRDVDIEFFLREKGCDENLIKEIRLFSFGRPGVAFDFFSDPSGIKKRRERVKELISTISVDAPFRKRLNYAKELADDSVKTKEILEIWLSYFRVLMIKKINEGCSLLNTKKSLERIEESIQLISTTNANKKMILEKLMMEL